MDSGVPFYSVVRKLPDCAVGEVFLAKLEGTGEDVLAHVLRPELTANPMLVERLRSATEKWKGFSHPHLARVLGLTVRESRVVLLTEKVPGDDLSIVLRQRGPLSPDDVVRLAAPICEALDALHGDGGVHLGIRSDRLVFPADRGPFDVVLTGFETGLVYLALMELAGTGGLVMAEDAPPELLRGRKADARSDVYQLGPLLYQALTAKVVPADRGRGSPLPAPPPLLPLPESGAHLVQVIRRCLEADPEKRFATAGAVSEALADAQRNRTWQPSSRTPLPVEAGEPEESDPEKAGDTVGSYQLVELLGEGSMGRVFLARHLRLDRHMALKLLRADLTRQPELVKRFLQEARTVNQINHEHIVEVFDFVEELEPRRVYCVMELLKGHSLSALMRSEILSVPRIVNIARQVCDALAAAHRVDVVHRDVKPDNIFIAERGHDHDYVKMLDFGVAKLMAPVGEVREDGTVPGILVGTPTYMSPEQAAGLTVDHRADIFALGSVLYEMIAGHPPFRAPTVVQLAADVIARPTPPLPEATRAGEAVPAGLRDIVMRCLEKEPAKRPQSMAAVAAVLEPFAGTEPQVFRPRRSRSRLIAVAAVLAVAAIGAVALVRRPEPAAAPAPTGPAAPMPATVTLSVTSTPPGAHVVRLDSGEEVGRTPFSLSVPRSDRDVSFRLNLEGFEPTERTVTLNANATLQVDLKAIARPGLPKKAGRTIAPAGKKAKLSHDGVIDAFGGD